LRERLRTLREPLRTAGFLRLDMKRFLRTLTFLIAVAFWCLSFYLLLSRQPYVGDIRRPDYAHTLMFFGLAFMTTCAQRRPNIVLTLAVLYLFGGLSEIAQHFLPPRTCDPVDFLEDVLGSTGGLVAALVWKSLVQRIALARWQRGRTVAP